MILDIQHFICINLSISEYSRKQNHLTDNVFAYEYDMISYKSVCL